MQSCGAGRNRDSIFCADVFGETLFELRHSLTLAYPATAKHLQNCFFFLFAHKRAGYGDIHFDGRSQAHTFTPIPRYAELMVTRFSSPQSPRRLNPSCNEISDLKP